MYFQRNLNSVKCFSTVRHWLYAGQTTKVPNWLGGAILSLLVWIGSPVSVAQQYSDEEIGQMTRYYLDTARDGDAEAQYMAAYAYSQGFGVPVMPEKARFWLEKSAAQDFAPAVVQLGHELLLGIGKPGGIERGKALLNHAIELGAVDPYVILGAYYMGLNSNNVPLNTELAAQHLKQGAKLGHPAAMLYLGVMYHQGLEPDADTGAELNVDEAIHWYSRAAALGHVQAMAGLASLYTDPAMGLMDYAKSYRWLYTTKLLGIDEYRSELVRVELQLSSAKRKAMQFQAEEWVRAFKNRVGLNQ